jgi:hypothetical protein
MQVLHVTTLVEFETIAEVLHRNRFHGVVCKRQRIKERKWQTDMM